MLLLDALDFFYWKGWCMFQIKGLENSDKLIENHRNVSRALSFSVSTKRLHFARSIEMMNCCKGLKNVEWETQSSPRTFLEHLNQFDELEA